MKAFEGLLFQLATIMGGFGIYETIYGKWNGGPITYDEGQFDGIRLLITVVVIVALCTFYGFCLADQSDSVDEDGNVVEEKLFDPKNGPTIFAAYMAVSFLFVVMIAYYLMGLRQAFCFGVSMTLLLSADGVKFLMAGIRRGRREAAGRRSDGI